MEKKIEEILGIVRNISSKVDDHDTKLGAIDNRLTSVETRLDSVENRLTSVEARFDSVEARFDSVEARFDSVENRFDSVDNQFASIDRQFAEQGHLNRKMVEKLTILEQKSDEQTRMLRSLVEVSQVHRALLDSYGVKMAKVEKVMHAQAKLVIEEFSK